MKKRTISKRVKNGLVAALEAEFGEEAAPAAERVQKWLQRMLELGLLRLESGK